MAVKQFRLPGDAKFIVAQSLAVKNKAASNDFNTRVVECRLASQVSLRFDDLRFNEQIWIYDVGFQIIAKQLNLKWKDMTVLAVLQKSLGNTLDQMIKLVHQNLHVEAYSKKKVTIRNSCSKIFECQLTISFQVCNILSVSENELDELSLTPNTIHVNEFFLHQRALHVFEG